MKVLHVIDSGGLYGAEVMLLNLAAEQIRLGLEPVIASIGELGVGEKPFEKEARKQGVKIKKFRMTPGPNVVGASRVLRFARKIHVDLLHSHGYKGNILFGFIPHRMRAFPLVSTLHGWTSIGGFSKMAAYEALDRLALRFVDAVVCVNAAMLEKPELKWLRRRRPYVVNNGLSGKAVAMADRSEAIRRLDANDAMLFGKELIIGTIGRLSKEKGYDYLIAALNLIIDSGINAHLVIIGEGNQRQRLTAMAKQKGLQNRVHLIGYRPDASMYIPLFHVYAISSLTEGLPITLLETMQARTPVVATRVGGIPNVLDKGRAGILVEPACSRSLADGIISIIKDHSSRTVLTQNAYDQFVNNYTSRKMAEGYLNVYRKVIRA